MSATVLEGDALSTLATLPAEAFQCCITSPPYFGLRDYGVAGQMGLEATPDAYVAGMVAVFAEVRRVLRDDGTLWLNIGDSYCSTAPGTRNAPQTKGSATDPEQWANPRPKTPIGMKPKDLIGIPWMLAFALRADGWYLRADIIWHKPNPMPESIKDRPTKAHEYVFLLTKQPRYFYDQDAIVESAESFGRQHTSGTQSPKTRALKAAGFHGEGGDLGLNYERETRNSRSVWTVATEAFSGAHFATMPTELARRCIAAGSSERGQCPHCGAPWVRVIGKGEPDPEWQERCGADASGGYAGQSTKGHDDAGVQNASDVKRRILAGLGTKKFLGWRPSCACPPHEPVPQHVLDPFGGAGTTALVAERLKRDATIIELNPEYAAMARSRIIADAPLLAEVA